MFKKLCLLCISVLITLSLTSCLDLTRYTETDFQGYWEKMNDILYKHEHGTKNFEITKEGKRKQEITFYNSKDFNCTGDSIGSATIEDEYKHVIQLSYDSEIIKSKSDSKYNVTGSLNGIEIKDMPIYHYNTFDFQIQKYKDGFYKFENGESKRWGNEFKYLVSGFYPQTNEVVMTGDNCESIKYYISDKACKIELINNDGTKYIATIKYNSNSITIKCKGTYYITHIHTNVYLTDDTTVERVNGKKKFKVDNTIKLVNKNIKLDPIDTSNIE